MCSMALLNRGVRPESATLGYRNELDPRFPLTLPNRVRILCIHTHAVLAAAPDPPPQDRC